MTRTLPLLHVTSAADRDSDPDAIDTATEVYGDPEFVTDECTSSKAPAGRCDYTWRDEWTRCIYCRQPARLD